MTRSVLLLTVTVREHRDVVTSPARLAAHFLAVLLLIQTGENAFQSHAAFIGNA